MKQNKKIDTGLDSLKELKKHTEKMQTMLNSMRSSYSKQLDALPEELKQGVKEVVNEFNNTGTINQEKIDALKKKELELKKKEDAKGN